jgi:homopolymeric O-antigen transport system permease protein
MCSSSGCGNWRDRSPAASPASIGRVTETQVQPRQRPRPPAVGERDTQKRSGYVTVIRPASRWPRVDFRELWRFRELLAVFVWRDLKVRYKQTVIGVGWAVIQPLLPTVVYTLVFGKFANFPSDGLPYPIFAFAGVLIWQYFSAALTTSSGSLVANTGLITKVYFPRLLLPLGAVATPAVDLALGIALILGGMAWFGTWPGAEVVLAPLFVLIAFATALGAGLVLSALNVRYRDIPYVIPVFMQVLPFVSGVQYAISSLPVKWQWVLSANPLTAAVSGWRWTMLGGPQPVWGQVAISVSVAALLLLGGVAFFKRSEPRFADNI